jgi:acyl-homoserine-lactone acylase
VDCCYLTHAFVKIRSFINKGLANLVKGLTHRALIFHYFRTCIIYLTHPNNNAMRQFIFVFFLACISAASSAQIDLSRVTIMRDSFGVPHIHGGTDAEAEYGLAWAQCEDDFKDVQYQLLAGRGRLGEVLGKDGVLFDYGLKFLSIDTLVAARYDKDLTPSFRHIVDAYIQGVNDYARAHPEEVLVKNALPFQQQDVIKGYTLNLSLMAGMGMALKAIKEDRISEFMKPNEIG